MDLQAAQDHVVILGSYSQDGGQIEGSIEGRSLIGHWAEDGSARKCETEKLGTFHWGRIEFTQNEFGSEFEGKWSYCDDEPDAAWTGKRPT